MVKVAVARALFSGISTATQVMNMDRIPAARAASKPASLSSNTTHSAGSTARARAEAQAAINVALDSSKQAAAAQAAVLNERLDRQLKEAEGQIAAARGAALAALPGVATDTAVALITRLTGAAPDLTRLRSAINAAMAARGAGQ